MKNKLLIICIISMFLLTNFACNVEANNQIQKGKIYDPKKHCEETSHFSNVIIDGISGCDYKEIYKDNGFDSSAVFDDTINNIEILDGPNFAVVGFASWYAPPPNILPENIDYHRWWLTYTWLIENIGDDWYNQGQENYWLNISEYEVYPNGDNEFFSFISIECYPGASWKTGEGVVKGCMQDGENYSPDRPDRPIAVRIEVTSTIPETNLSDNTCNSFMYEGGVVIEGRVTHSRLFGIKTPVIFKPVACLADDSYFYPFYSFACTFENSCYFVTAPYTEEPRKYDVRAWIEWTEDDSGKNQTKTTDALAINEIYTLNFNILETKVKSINPFVNFLQKVADKIPALENVIHLMLERI